MLTPATPLTALLKLGYRLENDREGHPVVSYVPVVEDLTPPVTHDERIEWVRQSYERFIEKVQERDTIVRQIAVELG